MSQFNEHMQAQYAGRPYLPKITLTKANGIMLELDDSMLVQGSIGLTFSITQGELLTFGNAIASELRFTAFRTQELYDFVKDGVVKLTLEMVSGEDTFITYQSSIIDPPKISDERIEFTSVDDLAKLDELYVPDVDRPRVFTEGATLLDVVQNVFRVVLPLYTVEINETDITTDLPVAAISDEVFQESTYREIVRWALEALALNASIHGNTIRLTRFGFEAISITEKVMFDRKISENTYVYTGATLEGPEETFYSSGNKVLEYRVEGNPFLLTSGSQAHTDNYLSAISSAGFTPFKVSALAVFDSSALMSKLTVPDRDGGTITGYITRIETKVDGRSTIECQGLDYVPTVGQLRSSGAVRLRRQEIKSTLNRDIIFENIEAKHKIAMDTYEIEKQERIDAVQEAKTEFTNSLADMDAVLSGKLDSADFDAVEEDILSLQSRLDPNIPDSLAYQVAELEGIDDEVLDIQNRLDPEIPDSLAYQVASHTSTIAEQGGRLETLRGEFDSLGLGERNLLLDSNPNLTKSGYVNRYDFPLSEEGKELEEGEEITVIIKGRLGEGKEYFGLYHSGGMDSLSFLGEQNKIGEDLYRGTFTWKWTQNQRRVRVRAMPQNVVSSSTIEWIKLVRGDFTSIDWSPAPEELATSKEFNDYKQTSEGYFQRIQSIETDLESGATYTKIHDIKNTADRAESTLAQLTDGDVTAYNQKISTALGDVQTIMSADYATQISNIVQTSEGYFQKIQSIETDLESGETYTRINDAKSTADRVESTLAQITDGDVTAYNQKISTAIGDIQTIKDADYAAQISSTASELSSQISNKASTSELISLINQQAGRVIIGAKSGTTGSVLKITPENIDVNGVVISGGNIKANTISGSHITVDNALATKLTASSLIADQMWTKYLSAKELSADYLSAGIIQKNGSYWNLNTGDVNLGGILKITNGVSSLDPQKVITTVQDTQQWKDLSGRVSTATQTAEQLMVQFQNNTKANLLPSTFNFTPMPTIYFGGAGSYTRTVTAGDLEIINEGGYYGEETRIAYQLARDVALNGQYFTLSGKFISTWNGDTRLRFRFPGENAWKYADIQNTDYYHDFSVTWQTNVADGSRVGEIYFQVYNRKAASGTKRAQIKLQGQSLKLEEGRASTPWTRAESEMIRTSSYTFDEKSVRFTYDGQDKLVFDGMTGNLDITGRINATGGTIGAWDIYADGRLIGEKNGVKIQLDPRGLYNPIQYNVGTTNYFSLNRDGSMYSRSADMSGSFAGSGSFTSGSFAGSHSGSGSFTSGSYAGNHSGYGSFSSGSYTGSGYFSSGSTIAGYPITATSNGIKVGKLTCDYLTVNTELGYGSVRVGSYQLARATSDNNAMWISSDVRLKEGIADVGDSFNDLIYSLPIISYALKDDKDKQPTLGINANLVARLYQEEQTKYFIRKDPVTERYEARYTEFIPMLIKTIQDLNERLKKVEDK